MEYVTLSQKRLTRELHDYDYQHTSVYTTSFLYKGQIVYINHNNLYPFIPPKITINRVPLVYSRNSFPPRLWDKYYDKFKKCMCCENIQCPDKWSPTFNVFHILYEYESFKEKLKIIQKKYMFQFINLPDDMIYEILGYL